MWPLFAALTWSAPAECPSDSELSARVAAIVGVDLAKGADADITVTHETSGPYVATVRIRDRGGKTGARVLEESSCSVLVDAVATVVALSLGSEPTAPRAPDSEAPEPPAPEVPVVESAKPPAPEVPKPPADQPSRAPEPPRPEPKFAVGVVVAVDHGTLPSTAIEGGVEVAWYPIAPLRLGAAVVRSADQSQAVNGAAFGGVFTLTAVDLRSCFSLLDKIVTLAPCGGVEIAHVDAYGYGSSTVETTSVNWWSPTAALMVRWPATRGLAFTALGDLAFPMVRRSFVIVDGGSIHRPAFAAIGGAFFAEVRF
jgi:hypothetical protein